MEALSDALADQEEIDQAIQSGGLSAVAGTSMGGGDVDEDELEKELQGLVEDKQKADESERVADKERREEMEKKRKENEVEERLARLRPVAGSLATRQSPTTKEDVDATHGKGLEAA